MTKERQALIDRFQKWLDTKPREQIIAAQCATIAEEYADNQLRIHDVVGRSEQIVCPNCKSKHIGTSTHKGFLQGYCFVCSNHWAK